MLDLLLRLLNELALSFEGTFEFSIFVKKLLRIFAGGQLRVKRNLDLFSCVVVRADKFFFAAGQLITVGV